MLRQHKEDDTVTPPRHYDVSNTQTLRHAGVGRVTLSLAVLGCALVRYEAETESKVSRQYSSHQTSAD